MNKVLIIIPAHNEEGAIGALLDQLCSPQIKAFADILVINDASKDRTRLIAKEHGVAILTFVFNLGYGSALQAGYKYAVRWGYDTVLQIDADGQHDASNIDRLYTALRTPDADGRLPDIVLGSRFLKGSQSFHVSGVKRISIQFFRWLIRRITNQNITDPTSGLQGLSRNAFLYYSQYQNFDCFYPDANMIIQMGLLGFQVVEIPAIMHERKTGVSMHSGIIKPMIYMMVMPLNILTVVRSIQSGRQKA